MSFSTLGIGVSALTAAARAVELAAHNVANSSVDGFTRQRLELVASPPQTGPNGVRGGGQRGTGVSIVSINRLRSALADVAVRGEASAAGLAGAKSEVLDRAQGVLGAYGDGVPASLSKLFVAFDQLALNPTDPAVRQIAIDGAATLANGLKDAALELHQIRSDATAQSTASLDEVNGLSQEVADLNRRISEAVVVGQQPNDLLDRRDVVLDRLASTAGVVSRTRDDAMVDVTLNGVSLVRGVKATAVQLTLAPPAAPAQGSDHVFTLEGNPVTLGGSLGGRAEALRVDLRDFETKLNTITAAITTAVNTQHRAGVDVAGVAGGDLFTGTTARDVRVAAGITPKRLAASATPVPPATFALYNGENALELARLRSPAAGLTDALNGLAATLGSRAAGAARTASAAEAGLDGVREQRNTAHGVSIDEEMIDLVRFQHAYDAAARVISVADGMLDTLINRMGAGR